MDHYMKRSMSHNLQEPMAWNKKVDSYLAELGFIKCNYEYGVYVQSKEDDIKLICLYVDDLLVTWKNIHKLNMFKHLMVKEFEMSYLWDLSYFLCM